MNVILSILLGLGGALSGSASDLNSNGFDGAGTKLADTFAKSVDRRLDVPEEVQQRYAELLTDSLSKANLRDSKSQFVLLVDRSPSVQAVMIFWLSDTGNPFFIGASPTSTGKPGRFEYFETPLGVFDHSLENPDFRAEGTLNENGILGYGRKGMRIYDFGWVRQAKGWGNGGDSFMRLQLHATDPSQLEWKLGTPQSKGCIRVPATFNTFLDHYGIIDADYERRMAEGKKLWVMNPDREPTSWSGRYLVIVDSNQKERPSWSPVPVEINGRS
jgi:hypothetical protein